MARHEFVAYVFSSMEGRSPFAGFVTSFEVAILLTPF